MEPAEVISMFAAEPLLAVAVATGVVVAVVICTCAAAGSANASGTAAPSSKRTLNDMRAVDS
jgi:hypothetical protein